MNDVAVELVCRLDYVRDLYDGVLQRSSADLTAALRELPSSLTEDSSEWMVAVQRAIDVLTNELARRSKFGASPGLVL
ncbi:MAG: hypothetical protein ACOCTG_00475 [Bacteroidota bacterium]